MFADAMVGAMDLAVEREQKADGVLGHGVRRVGGHAGDGKAERLRGREVNIVEARAAQGHEPDASIVKLLQTRSAEPVVDKHEDGLRPAG